MALRPTAGIVYGWVALGVFGQRSWFSWGKPTPPQNGLNLGWGIIWSLIWIGGHRHGGYMEGKIGIILDLHGPTFVLRDWWLWVFEASVFLVGEVSCEVIYRVFEEFAWELNSPSLLGCLDCCSTLDDSSIVLEPKGTHHLYTVYYHGCLLTGMINSKSRKFCNCNVVIPCQTYQTPQKCRFDMI